MPIIPITMPTIFTSIANELSFLSLAVALSPRFLIAARNIKDGYTKIRAVPNTAPLIEDTNERSVSFHANAVTIPRSPNVVWFKSEADLFSSGTLRRSRVPSLVPTKRSG